MKSTATIAAEVALKDAENALVAACAELRAYREDCNPTFDPIGKFHSSILSDICRSFRHCNKAPFPFTEEETNFLMSGDHAECWKDAADLADKYSCFKSKMADISPLEVLNKMGNETARLQGVVRASENAKRSAGWELMLCEQIDAGFNTARDPKGAAGSVVRVERSPKGSKFAFHAISPTGGKWLLRIGTRPYIVVWIPNSFNGGTFSTSSNNWDVNADGRGRVFTIVEAGTTPAPVAPAKIAEPIVTEVVITKIAKTENKESQMSKLTIATFASIASIAQFEKAVGTSSFTCDHVHETAPAALKGTEESTPMILLPNGESVPLKTWTPDAAGRLRFKIVDLPALALRFAKMKEEGIVPTPKKSTPAPDAPKGKTPKTPKEPKVKAVKTPKEPKEPRSLKMLPAAMVAKVEEGIVTISDVADGSVLAIRAHKEGQVYVAIRLNGWMKTRCSLYATLEEAQASLEQSRGADLREDRDTRILLIEAA